MLPASKGAVVANLGVALANKVPVGLNFTASSEAIGSAIARADIETAISARQFHEWDQLTYAASGVMRVHTDIGSWLVPQSTLCP